MWEQFLEKYLSSPKEIQNFIDSEQIPLVSQKLIDGGVSNLPFREVVIHISDFVVGSINEASLKENLGMDGSQLLELLKELGIAKQKHLETQGNPEVNITLKERLELRPEGVPRPPLARNQVSESMTQPLTREDVISALVARRTMAGDIESIKNSQSGEEK